MIQIEIGKKYNSSMISFRDAIKNEIELGNINIEDVLSDEVHPNGYGHKIIRDLIIRERNFKSLIMDGFINLKKRVK